MNGGMLCSSCKGKGLCGLPRCPITARFLARVGTKPVSSYMGAAPSVFVGSYGYPAVQGGPLLLADEDRRSEMGRRARARVLRDQTWDHRVAMLRSDVREVRGRRRASGTAPG